MTPKQTRFVAEYLLDLCGTQAAIRAGYSAKTAQQQSSRLLLNVVVRAAVNEGLVKQQEKLELSAEKVLHELMRVAYTPVNPLDVRVADKLRGLEILAKHLSLLTQKVHVTSDIDYIQMVQRVREKLAKQSD